MKVVIIDDDKLVSMSLKMILENGTDIEVAGVRRRRTGSCVTI